MKCCCMTPKTDSGMLVIRIGIGLLFLNHGVPKLLGGPEFWAKLGSAMGNFGIDFGHAFFGFFAAFAEAVGGLLLISGFLLHPACLAWLA